MSTQIDSARTALLVLDHQAMLIEGYTTDPVAHLARVAALLDKVRTAGLPVFYVTVGFRPGYPEVSDNNLMFSGVRAGRRFKLGDPGSAIPPAIAPAEQEPVIIKHRVSAFHGTDLETMLKARRIDTLAMFGIATSGVVTSTVRAGADLDYRMIVISDLCADNDAKLHGLLIERLLPRQAEVVDAETFLSRLSA